MIRNVVFDMGQVVLRFDPEYFITKAGVTDPGARQMLKRELFQSLEWAEMDYGRLTEETAEPRVMRHVPERLAGEVHRLLFHWADWRSAIDGMEDLIRKLKEAGYGVYLLSNASKGQHRYWSQFGVSRYFDGKLISADVGVIKPMPEIYRLFIEKFQLKPEGCVFVDDLTANVAAAVHEGWQGIVFHGDAEELRRKLGEMGAKIPQ